MYRVKDKYEIIPKFEYDIAEWNPKDASWSVYCSEDNKSLIQYFGKWERIKTSMPAIAEVIQSLAQSETVLVADMDAFVRKRRKWLQSQRENVTERWSPSSFSLCKKG